MLKYKTDPSRSQEATLTTANATKQTLASEICDKEEEEHYSYAVYVVKLPSDVM